MVYSVFVLVRCLVVYVLYVPFVLCHIFLREYDTILLLLLLFISRGTFDNLEKIITSNHARRAEGVKFYMFKKLDTFYDIGMERQTSTLVRMHACHAEGNKRHICT